MMDRLFKEPFDLPALKKTREVIELLQLLPMEVNYWQMQNIYYRIAGVAYEESLKRSKAGDRDAAAWLRRVQRTGPGALVQCAGDPA